MINIIAAITSNNALGKDGDQLYYISDDLKHFKELTLDKTIVMGRRTFEALPKGALPRRRNVVLTRQRDYEPPGAEKADSLDELVKTVNGDIFIIGGGEIYRQAMSKADRLYITEIDVVRSDADTFFPEISGNEWRKGTVTEWFRDEKSNVNYRFVCYDRKK